MNAAPQRSFLRRQWPTLVAAGVVLSGVGYVVAKGIEMARSAARRTNDR
jgi:hypothetical protein